MSGTAGQDAPTQMLEVRYQSGGLRAVNALARDAGENWRHILPAEVRVRRDLRLVLTEDGQYEEVIPHG